MLPKVRAERTGWRDLRLSERHRRWGWNCPAVDLDFLFLEYDKGKPVAIVEYKHESADPQYRTHPTYQAMINLANGYQLTGLPIFGVRYADDFSTWQVTPLNKCAKAYVPKQITFTERGWVTLLYRMRGYALPEDFFSDSEVQM